MCEFCVNLQKKISHKIINGNFDLCYGIFLGTAARGALQDVKRERPTSRFAAV